jgi:hypothetical protein
VKAIVLFHPVATWLQLQLVSPLSPTVCQAALAIASTLLVVAAVEHTGVLMFDIRLTCQGCTVTIEWHYVVTGIPVTVLIPE